MWIYAAPALVGVWAIIRAAVDPRRLIRPDAERIAYEILRGDTSVDDAVPKDIGPMERTLRFRALLDAVEPPPASPPRGTSRSAITNVRKRSWDV